MSFPEQCHNCCRCENPHGLHSTMSNMHRVLWTVWPLVQRSAQDRELKTARAPWIKFLLWLPSLTSYLLHNFLMTPEANPVLTDLSEMLHYAHEHGEPQHPGHGAGNSMPELQAPPSRFLSCFNFLYLLVFDHRNFNLWWIYICIEIVPNLIKSLNVFGKAVWTWSLTHPTSGNETEWEWNDRKLFLCFITWIWKGTHLYILPNLYQIPKGINQRSLALQRMWIFKKCHWLWGNTS